MLRGTAEEELHLQVEALLKADEAAWCPMVRLELWAGERDARQRRQLEALDETIPSLSIGEKVWHEAVELTRRARAAGVAVAPNDFVIIRMRQNSSRETAPPRQALRPARGAVDSVLRMSGHGYSEDGAHRETSG